MKYYILLAFFVFGLNGFSQILDPVKWSTSVEKISDTEYDLVITADIEKDWHLYSQYTAEGGSLPIEISKKQGDKNNEHFELVGKAVESDTIKKYNDVFEVTETFFAIKGILKQRITLKNKDVSVVSLNLTGQVCKEVCLQIYEDFTFQLSGNNAAEVTNNTTVDNTSVNQFLYGLTAIDLTKSNNNCNDDATVSSSETKEDKSLWSIFGLGFLGGLLALLTPCVFPMIPLTVSFFTKKSGANK
ncbi:MAG: protein-disulfide reductase DsbD domain-containing protein, partial [Flavobacteriales bacterium]